jgi:TMPIT-like protein
MLKWSLGSAQFFLPESRKLRYKTEYEHFKLQLTLSNFLLSFTNLFIIKSDVLDMIHHFLLLYFYSTITLREQILCVNGSRIRTWWLLHHYLSILVSALMLIWPRSWSYEQYRPVFLTFSIYLSAVQYLQFRYQMSRLYTLRALSKIGPMDVTTDSAQVHVRNNLTFLLPFLLFGQCFQAYNAYFLLSHVTFAPNVHEWHPFVAGIIFALIAFGNMSTTLHTYYQKVKKTMIE